MAVISVVLAACAVEGTAAEQTESSEEAFSSARATLTDFELDGEVVAAAGANARGAIRSQLLYTVGQLNAVPGVSQLPKAVFTNINAQNIGGGLQRITYHAKVPVAWGARNVPSSFTLTLPRRVGSSSETTFVNSYRDQCADEPASSTPDNFWYHFRPHQSGCSFGSNDVVRTTASVRVSPRNTTGKYPEYHRIWEDGLFRIVAIFGKEQEGATDDADPGIRGYNDFIASLRSTLRGATVTPAIDSTPGVGAPEVTLTVDLNGGRRVEATVMLVDKLATEGAAFDKRYAELSPGADLILYNGHAGLGANARALAAKGNFVPQKYQVFFFNGCDTFAYIDETLAEKRAQLNPDDPAGTRHMDIVTNAMPAYFHMMSRASMAFVQSVLSSSPKTYEKLFADIDAQQIAVVTGEEDNAFAPSLATQPSFTFVRTGAVDNDETVSFETPVLNPGTYTFTLLPDPARPAGDADLRLRAGAPPTLTPEYRCKSYVANSNERCTLTLSSPSKVFLAVTGDVARESSFELRAFLPR